jgi:flagellar biosynthesis/type III secretory pathway chaperone
LESSSHVGLFKQGLKKANVLQTILRKEADALAARSIDTFELLQSEKSIAVDAIQAVLDRLSTSGISFKTEHDNETVGQMSDELASVLEKCKQQHEGNAVTIDKLLEANKAALNVLRSTRRVDATETYDKLGKVSRHETMGHESEA